MRNYKFVSETGSTNSDIKNEIYSSSVPCFTVLRAGRQTGGRGRLGRSFFSPDGGLYFSISLPVEKAFGNIPVITLLSGLAAAESIDELCSVTTEIKWPNDIYLNGKKLGGILTELISGRVLTAVVGVGINLTVKKEEVPEELRSRMTSLFIENGTGVSPEVLMRRITEKLDNMMKENNIPVCIEKIRRKSFLNGRQVSFEKDGNILKGTFRDIAENGTAVIETVNGERIEVLCGELTDTAVSFQHGR